MRTCDGSTTQRWSFLLSGEIVVPTTQRGGRCLTLTSVNNRTQLTVGSCRTLTDPLKSQQLFWYDTGGHLHPNGAPHKCVEAGGSTEGAPVQVFDCNSTAPQMWLPGA